jgi:hypothetical protein
MAEKLKFYDVKGKKKFTSDKYKVVEKKGRRFAVADAPSGIKAWRIMGKAAGKTAPAKKKAKKKK